MAPSVIELEFNDFSDWFDPNLYDLPYGHSGNRDESFYGTRLRFAEEATIRLQGVPNLSNEEILKIEKRKALLRFMKYAWSCLDCANKIGRGEEYHSNKKGKTEVCEGCRNIKCVTQISMPAWYEICLKHSNKDLTTLYMILDKYYGSDMEPLYRAFEKSKVGNNENMVKEVNESLFTEMTYLQFRNCETVLQVFEKVKENKKVTFNRYTSLTRYQE